MGQATSSGNSPHTVRIVQGKLQQQVEIFKRIAHLSYKEFHDSVTELNRVTSSFSDKRGKQLRFSIKPGSDDTVLWKGTVCIHCQKINSCTGSVYSSRDLDLRHYIMVYREITEQVTNLQPAEPGGEAGNFGICASMILDEAEHKSLEMDVECCICMENEPKVILPCAHRFCERCFDSWNVSHNTCPICRAKVNSSNDTWVMTDMPSSSEFASEVKDVLVGIADRQSTSSDHHPS